MAKTEFPPGFYDMQQFGLIEALLGRRSRRFFMGAEIPDGVFAYRSKHDPVPLSELEKLLVVMRIPCSCPLWRSAICCGDSFFSGPNSILRSFTF